MKIETVVIIYKPPKILLGMKKKGFGVGNYNGFGGGVEKEETLEECVIRGTKEEAGITILDHVKSGKILFRFESKEPDHLVHFFMTDKFVGSPSESEKMKPKWFNEKEIPYSKMWPGDEYWLPILLKRREFEGEIKFYSNKKWKIKSFKVKKLIAT